MPHLQIKELRVTIIKQFLQPSGCLFSNESHRFPWLESMMFAQLKHQKSFTSSPGWVLVRAMHQGDIHSVPQLWQESLPARMQTASPSSVFTPAKRQRMKEESHRPPFVCSVHSGSPCTNHIYLKKKKKKEWVKTHLEANHVNVKTIIWDNGLWSPIYVSKEGLFSVLFKHEKNTY